jgi:GTP-binding protein HflX
LEDSIESQILLHVIDASDQKVDEKIRVVDEILENIGANQKRIYVFNKIDGVGEDFEKEKYVDLQPIFISAAENI